MAMLQFFSQRTDGFCGRKGRAMKIFRTSLRKKALRPHVPRMKSVEKTSLRDKLLGVAILFGSSALFLWLTVLVCKPLVSLVEDPASMRSLLAAHWFMGRLAFLGIQVLQGILPVPLELTTVAGGYVFGRLQGCLLTLCSTVISTAVIFIFTRLFGHRLADLFFTPARQRAVRYFRDEKMRDMTTLAVFLIPGTPKRLIVFSAGLTPQKFGRFLAISTLARLPSLLACSYGGDAIGDGNYFGAVAVFFATGAVAALSLLFYRSVTRGKKEK